MDGASLACTFPTALFHFKVLQQPFPGWVSRILKSKRSASARIPRFSGRMFADEGVNRDARRSGPQNDSAGVEVGVRPYNDAADENAGIGNGTSTLVNSSSERL